MTVQNVRALWNRVPVVVRAPITGLIAATAGTLPWAMLVAANLKHWPAVPWAVPPTALYLWLYWRYVRGAWWPQSTAATRRVDSRVNRVADDVWGMALVAGVVGLAAVVMIQGVLGRLVSLPQQKDLDPSQYPFWTVLLWILMSAVVAGVVEETAFRGFMQRPIERRHGPVVAILVTGIAFAFGHFTHPEVSLVLLPYYLAVAAVYGTLAYLTDSILPSLVLHAGGNVLSAFDLFTRGRSEWQLSAKPASLIWVTGADTSFWLSVAAVVIVGALAAWSFSALARVARESRAH